MDLPKALFSQSPRHPTDTSGWGRHLACIASMASETSFGSHRQISISLPVSSRDWLRHATEPFGSAHGMGSQAGRTASSLSTRSSVNRRSLLSLKMTRARYGLGRRDLLMENSAKFGMAASGAARR